MIPLSTEGRSGRLDQPQLHRRNVSAKFVIWDLNLHRLRRCDFYSARLPRCPRALSHRRDGQELYRIPGPDKRQQLIDQLLG